MKILLVCLMMNALQIVEPSARTRRWKEQQEEEQSQPEIATAEERLDERSSWNGDTDQPAPFFAESSPSSTLWSPEQRKRVTAESAEYGPAWIRVSARSSCSCESQYEILDLGDSHYPRYLTASRCKSKTCQSKLHSCRLLHYMVHVLRLRESNAPPKEWYINDHNLPETPLPESLRHKWQLKPISVAPSVCWTPATWILKCGLLDVPFLFVSLHHVYKQKNDKGPKKAQC